MVYSSITPADRGDRMVALAAAALAAFPDEVWELVFSFASADADRNAISLVCKAWNKIERACRRKIFVGNCYAVSPRMAIGRFRGLRAVWIKGKPHFADFNLVPYNWGGGAYEWIATLGECCPGLEELRFKRMVVTDECLEVIATSFGKFRVLVMVSCEGFSTVGLAAIAANCRYLQELDLQECEVEDRSGHWLGRFPETFNSLTSLSLACLEGDMNISVLERLVNQCPKLTSKIFSGVTSRPGQGFCNFHHVDNIGLDAISTTFYFGNHPRHLVPIESIIAVCGTNIL